MALWRPGTRGSLALLAIGLAVVVTVGPIAAAITTDAATVSSGQAASDGPVASEAPWGVWITETFEDRKPAPWSSIAWRSTDRPLVGYHEFGRVMVAERTVTGWNQDVVVASIASGYVSLALDSADRAHLSYIAGSPSLDLEYAVQTSSGWQTETVDQDGGRGVLGIAPGGQPHIVYQRLGELWHAWKTSSGWQTEAVYSDDVFGWFDAAVDSQGRVHVIFEQKDPAKARYGVRALDGTWTFTDLSKCGVDFAIDVDSSDRPHIACHQHQKGLAYYQKTASGWRYELAEDGSGITPSRSGSDTGYEPSIVIDSKDRPHVSWRTRINPFSPELSPRNVYYTAKVGGAWHTEHVDPDGARNGPGSSITLTGEDRPVISYQYERRLGDLNHDCLPAVNPCNDLRVAFPASAAASVFAPVS